MAKYCPISLDDMTSLLAPLGYGLTTEERCKEWVFAKPIGKVQIKVYSSIDISNDQSRKVGKDAIRAIIYATEFSTVIGGERRVNRVGDNPGAILRRLKDRLESVERRGGKESIVYSALGGYKNINAVTDVVQQPCILVKVKSMATKSGKPCYEFLYKSICQCNGYNIYLSTKRMDVKKDVEENIGSVYVVKSLGVYKTNTTGQSIFINCGKYGYTFEDSDDGLILEDYVGEGTLEAEVIRQTHISPDKAPDGIILQPPEQRDIIDPPSGAVGTEDKAGIPPAPEVELAINFQPPVPTDISELQNLIKQADTIPTKWLESTLGLKYDFDYLNPVQAKALKGGVLEDKNVILSAPTSSGKTLVAEVIIAKHLPSYKLCIYLVPLKSLAEEIFEELQVLFPKHRVEISTGDYEITSRRLEQLMSAHILICTYEMLAARLTKRTKEGNRWLGTEVACLVVDEAHVIGQQKRGDKIETLLMDFTDVNKTAQILLLSATLSKLDKFANWIKTLTGRDTVVIDSTWRPVKLNIEMKPYLCDPWNFDGKYDITREIVETYPVDKFIIFCPSRAESYKVAYNLNKGRHSVAYHNATLSLEDRRDVENDFKYGNLRIISSTTTLAMGVNLPARRVIVFNTYRGLNPIDSAELLQCCGRAGRVQYDTQGDAYILCSMAKVDEVAESLKNVAIRSVLVNFDDENEDKLKISQYRHLMFHINNNVYAGRIKSRADAEKWLDRSFAKELYKYVLGAGESIDKLLEIFCITEDNGVITNTRRGEIAAMLYLYPDDIACLENSFRWLYDENMLDDDVAISMALVYPSLIEREPYVGKHEVEDVTEFYLRKVRPYQVDYFMNNTIASKFALWNYYCLTETGPEHIRNSIRADISRIMTAVKLSSYHYRWKDDKRAMLDAIELRMRYGIPLELVELVKIRGIGGARAKTLYDAGIKSIADVLSKPEEVKKHIGNKVGISVINDAYRLSRKGR